MSVILNTHVLSAPLFNDLNVINTYISYLNTYFVCDEHCNILYKFNILDINNSLFSYNEDTLQKIKKCNQYVTIQHYIFKLPIVFTNIFDFKKASLCLYNVIFSSPVKSFNLGLLTENCFSILDTLYEKEDCITTPCMDFYIEPEYCKSLIDKLYDYICAKFLLDQLH